MGGGELSGMHDIDKLSHRPHLSCQTLDGVKKDRHVLSSELIVWVAHFTQCAVALLSDTIGSAEGLRLLSTP